MAGVGDVVLLVSSWVLSTSFCFAIVIGDERDLTEEQHERAWPPSSRAAALVGLGILALPFHFAKTRGDWWPPRAFAKMVLGFVIGIGALAGNVIVTSYILEAFARALGYPVD